MPTQTAELVEGVLKRLGRIHLGPKRNLELLLAAFFAGGHVLLEDIPGVGKTTLARGLAQLCQGSFRRIQCTPI